MKTEPDLTSQFLEKSLSKPLMEEITNAKKLSDEQLQAALSGIEIELEVHKVTSSHGNKIIGAVATLISSGLMTLTFVLGGQFQSFNQITNTMLNQDSTLASKTATVAQVSSKIASVSRSLIDAEASAWMKVFYILFAFIVFGFLIYLLLVALSQKQTTKKIKILMIKRTALYWVKNNRDKTTT